MMSFRDVLEIPLTDEQIKNPEAPSRPLFFFFFGGGGWVRGLEFVWGFRGLGFRV